MLKGDLTTTPLATLLLQLGGDRETGCLKVNDGQAEAEVYFREGDIYAVAIPGLRSRLGAKLVSSGALTPDALAQALDAQRTEMQGWKLGELLVHMGYVDQRAVEAFVKEQVDEALWDLLRWSEGSWKFRVGERTREDVAAARDVGELFEVMRARNADWEAIAQAAGGPAAVPTLISAVPPDREAALDAEAWSMVCKIDGERTLVELARDCGYTLFEAGRVLVGLSDNGLVDVTTPVDAGHALHPADEESSAREPVAACADGSMPIVVTDPQPEDALSRLARLVDQVQAAGGGLATGEPSLAEPGRWAPSAPMTARRNRESFGASIARVSAALSDAKRAQGQALATVVRLAAPQVEPPPWADERSEQRAAAAAALRELSIADDDQRPARSPRQPEPPQQPQPHPEPAREAHAAAEPEAVDDAAGVTWEPALWPARRYSSPDTAALLRELSSLGGEEEHPPSQPPAAAARPRPRPLPAVDRKKKRGLFSR
jgi:hypothetical protein